MDFIQIVQKVLSNEPLTDEQLDLLVMWMISDDGRARLDDRLMDELQKAAQLRGTEFDRQAALAALHKRIAARRPAPRRIRRYGRMAAAAAVVLVACGALFFALRSGYVRDELIVPGSHAAVLELSDGRSIALTDMDGGSIEQHGVRAMVSNGELSYRDVEAPDATVFNKVTIPRGGEYRIELGDGTLVWLNSESYLRYPLGFNGSERRVFLEGEAYFDVAHDPAKPFIVETPTQMLSVLGTEFNVQAYADQAATVTTLVEGSVEVQSINSTQRVTLAPGEQSELDGSGLFTVRKVDAGDVASWKSGLFVFDEHNLDEVMLKLARWYDIEVQFANPAARQIVFKGNLPKYENLQSLLNMIEKISPVSFEVRGRIVTVNM